MEFLPVGGVPGSRRFSFEVPKVMECYTWKLASWNIDGVRATLLPCRVLRPTAAKTARMEWPYLRTAQPFASTLSIPAPTHYIFAMAAKGSPRREQLHRSSATKPLLPSGVTTPHHENRCNRRSAGSSTNRFSLPPILIPKQEFFAVAIKSLSGAGVSRFDDEFIGAEVIGGPLKTPLSKSGCKSLKNFPRYIHISQVLMLYHVFLFLFMARLGCSQRAPKQKVVAPRR